MRYLMLAHTAALFVLSRDRSSSAKYSHFFKRFPNLIQAYTNACHHENKDYNFKDNIAAIDTKNMRYEIVKNYTASYDDEITTLPKLLHKLDKETFPSVSQARKACNKGRILICRNKNSALVSSDERYLDPKFVSNADSIMSTNTLIIADKSSKVNHQDLVLLHKRVNDYEFYPLQYSTALHPPPHYFDFSSIPIIYQDENIALVNKPEKLTTVGKSDLQSLLPFILKPPSSVTKNIPIPRPVHRIDRRTSGIVVISKSTKSTKLLSHQFATRQVYKSYVAIVFGRLEGKDWNRIDYPIDGKPSITDWKVIHTYKHKKFGWLSVVCCSPKTGRYHQIRRHLAYCLQMPIVGDAKYDMGGELRKGARNLGLFLCANAIDFQCARLTVNNKGIQDNFHDFRTFATTNILYNSDELDIPLENEIMFYHHEFERNIRIRARTPLPAKYMDLIGK